MENHFEICMTEDQLRGISSIGLAHMGDAVFELLVRGWLCQHGKATGKGLHQATIQLVRAEHQAACAEKILPMLTEEELADLMGMERDSEEMDELIRRIFERKGWDYEED